MQVNCSVIFKTNPTDRGMCCTFNALAAEKIYRESKFSESVSELQKQNVLDSFERKYSQVDFTDQAETQYLSDPSDLPPGFDSDDEPSPETGEISQLRLYFCPVFTLETNVIVVVRLYPDIIKLYQEKTEG